MQDDIEVDLVYAKAAPLAPAATASPASAPEAGDRRAHPRHVVRRVALLLIPGRKVIEARTLDISFGGLGVVSPEALPRNVRMLCRVNLMYRNDSDKLYDVAVEAMNCVYSAQHGGFKVGLQYRPLTPALQEAIRSMA